MGVTLSLSVKQNSQNITNNTSNVTVDATVTWDYGSWNSLAQCKGVLTIDGVPYQFSGVSFNSGHTNNGSQVVMTKTVTVSHAADGKKNLVCSAWFNTEISAGTVYADLTKTLTTIPRTSTPTLSASSVDMGQTVVIYTNRAAPSLTHDLAYSFAGSAYTTIATGVGSSYTWTTPNLASQIPNATSGTVTIRCITKNGSSTVGTATVVMTLKVPTAGAPTISALTITEATPGLAQQFGAYIQGKSTLNVKVTAAGAQGSTIRDYKIIVHSTVYHGQSITTDALNASGNVSVSATVTDSRGRTATKTVTITVLPYSKPSISEFRAFRCDASGSPSDDGVYLGVSYVYNVYSLGGKNTAAMKIEYKTEAAGSYVNTLATGSDLAGSGIRFFTSPTFSMDYQYNVRLTVTDWFGASTSYTTTLSAADVVLDISSDGTGLGIGKVSQRNDSTEFARKMYDRFDSLIGNGLAAYTGSGTAAIDPNTTLEHVIITNKNTPSTGFWYVMTLFYSTKAATSNRVQYAMPYTNPLLNPGLYVRSYYSGSWSSWVCAPYIQTTGSSSGWDYIVWSDGRVEMTKVYEIENMACNVALGSWYRTAVFSPGQFFPVYISDPHVSAVYESDGYGALLWATTTATQNSAPSYYLIRPTSTTIASGRVILRVTGKKA